jgi:hypothetical protein
MAEMVPDRLPSRASSGEKKLFSVLQKLPDDYIVYYEPIVEDRYPDFVVICPNFGLLVIEPTFRTSICSIHTSIIRRIAYSILIRTFGSRNIYSFPLGLLNRNS